MLHLNILENKINPEEKKGPFISIKPEKSKISDKNRSNNIEDNEFSKRQKNNISMPAANKNSILQNNLINNDAKNYPIINNNLNNILEKSKLYIIYNEI